MTNGNQNHMTSRFKHSGDVGDIIMSLPTIKALGGGDLYLDPLGGKNEPLVQGTDQGDTTKLNFNSIENLKELLQIQPYIKSIKNYVNHRVDYNLDEFRKHIKFNNLADSHLAAFNLDFKHRDEKWITLQKLNKVKPIIISRSCRYQGNHGYWGFFCKQTNMNDCLFLGHEKEHDIFEYTFNVKVDYLKTKTLIEAAEIIGGAELVVCNQNALYCIAEGLKKKIVQEVYRPYPATIFKREGVEYV